LPRDYWLQVLDVVALGAAMAMSVWLVLKRRSRRWLVAIAIGSLGYFGFYREGCICPIGSLQNVVVAIADPRYSIPMVVTATFVLRWRWPCSSAAPSAEAFARWARFRNWWCCIRCRCRAGSTGRWAS